MAFAFFRQITIDHTRCGSSNSTSFPVYVAVNNLSLADQPDGGHVVFANGADILFFADANATTQLRSEIESYDPVNGILSAWVQIPTVSASVDTSFYMFYGNAAPPARLTTPWDANYLGVWHMNAASDSTANANTLTSVGAPSFGGAGGVIDGATSFDGATQAVGTTNSVNLSGGKVATIELWLNSSTFATPAKILVETSANFNTNAGTLLLDPGGETGGKWGFVASKGDSTTYNGCTLNTNPSTGAFHHIVTVVDLSTGSALAITVYVDGASAPVTQNRVGDLSAINLANTQLFLMARNKANTWMPGTLDEVRISNTKRSADWILTSYNSQFAPGNIGSPGFLTYGGETPVTTGVVIEDHTGPGTLFAAWVDPHIRGGGF